MAREHPVAKSLKLVFGHIVEIVTATQLTSGDLDAN